MTKTLYYAGQPGEGYGWGVCNANLIRELRELCRVSYGLNSPADLSVPVFMPIADHDLNPASSVRGTKNFGYTFFEYPLGLKARENAKLYDLIFCGSTWCKERLAEIGVTHTEVLIQGVDHEIFKPGDEPQRHRDTEFRIFSGGKFEYRKGQDIVLAAFKLLQDKYPDMRLVTCWQNPWPDLVVDAIDKSKHLIFDWRRVPAVATQPELIGHVLEQNGIDKRRVLLDAGMMSQETLAHLMRSTDLGVFPNRCEGGTNLVLMEYLACGKPAIATTGTGHADIWAEQWDELAATCGANHWQEADPTLLAAIIEVAYFNPNRKTRSFPWAIKSMQQWTWRRAAEQIVSHL